jgi:2-dehydro-3-deoxyphosphogluconate aldolase/(4S)-4-hydroxy-2-oxoglutarate aldolase
MTENYIKLLCKQKFCPIIRNKDPEEVVRIAKALADGGVKFVEINVENSSIYRTIAEVSQYTNVCAGGIITTIQADAALLAGAKLLSSPIFSMNMVKFSKDQKVPYIAGTSTANEAYSAWKARMPLIKIYPISALGGVQYVESILRPMPFLNIMAQGDVKISEVKSYINAGAKVVGVGRDLYEKCSDREISARVETLIKNLRD